MKIELVYAPAPREVMQADLSLEEPCSVRDALTLSGWAARFPEIALNQVVFSVWGRKVAVDALLRDGDRLELCRPLRVDPKVARRERFVGQGARGTGLFAQRRPGSKAGY